MAKRTTETAEELFAESMKLALDAGCIVIRKEILTGGSLNGYDELLARSLYCLADGLKFLSIGLRETYNKLEEVERKAKH